MGVAVHITVQSTLRRRYKYKSEYHTVSVLIKLRDTSTHGMIGSERGLIQFTVFDKPTNNNKLEHLSIDLFGFFYGYNIEHLSYTEKNPACR